MNNKNFLKNVSFHDQEMLDVIIDNNNLTLMANDGYSGKKYTFYIKNAKVMTYVGVHIKDTINKDIITLLYHEFDDKENYIYLEIANNNSPFNDEFYIYSNDIEISVE